MGGWAVALMCIVGAACAAAALRLARGAIWGKRLAVIILGVNLIGDLGNAVLRHDPRLTHRPADCRRATFLSPQASLNFSGAISFSPRLSTSTTRPFLFHLGQI
jgi:hypothetical protein